MNRNLLPAAMEGHWVRLRPLSRSDHPRLFAERIDIERLHLRSAGVAIPSFEQWEAVELGEMLRGGPVMVVEDHDGEFLGYTRLYKFELRDGWAYIELRYAADISSADFIEASLGVLNYSFTQFNLRKLYAETIALNESLLTQLKRLHFREEVRLTKYLWHDGDYHDLIYFAMSRPEWERARELLNATVQMSHIAAQGPVNES